MMKRREFITLLGGAAVAWPLASRAQKGERMRHIGVLMPSAADDPVGQIRLGAFLQGLQPLGWAVGSISRKYAAELVALAPHVILAAGGSTVEPLLQVSRAVPIVFAIAPDPVGAGYVDSLGRPRGNVTGFATFEFGLGAKWLELLNEIAPGRTRVAVMRDPAVVTGIGQFGAIQSAAPSMGIEVSPINLLDADRIERAVADFVRSAHDGLIVAASALATKHRNLIVGLAARHNLPAVYNQRAFVAAGGLISYGPDLVDQYRRAAGYVDRILKGEKPADLPVQAPTKYELVINLKTAKALGLEVPPTVLALADEVIE